MARIDFTDPTYDVDNVQGLDDRPTESPTVVKQTFDKTGSDAKDFTEVLITELESTDSGDSGSQRIGYEGSVPGADNPKDAIDLIYDAGSGTIPPDGTITNAKLAADVKVGSLAALDTVDKASVVAAINEAYGRTVVIDILQAYDTAGTFTYTVPANVDAISAVIVGAGGGGGSGASSAGNDRRGGAGGGAGFVTCITRMAVTESQEIPVVIGVGGTGGTGAYQDKGNDDATSGGTSSFVGATASGGGKGEPGGNIVAIGGSGSADGGNGGDIAASPAPVEGGAEGTGIDSTLGLYKNGAINLITGVLYGAGGGGGSASDSGVGSGASGHVGTLGTGGDGGDGISSASGVDGNDGLDATGNIAGGGGGGGSYDATGGNGGDGADGYIIIYQVL